jgi:hypothetical protein
MTRFAAFLFAFLLAPPLRAAEIEGVFALADAPPRVTGSASVGVTPLAGMGAEVAIALAMRPLGSLRRATRYDLELGKRLHLIAISADGRGFVHEHGGRPDGDGVFRMRLRLPWGRA